MKAKHVRPGEYGAVFKYVLLLPAVLWVVAFTFVPLIFVIRYSLTNYVLGLGITDYIGLENYADVLASDRFWHSIMITAAYVAVSVPIEVILGFLTFTGRSLVKEVNVGDRHSCMPLAGIQPFPSLWIPANGMQE